MQMEFSQIQSSQKPLLTSLESCPLLTEFINASFSWLSSPLSPVPETLTKQRDQRWIISLL